MALEKQNVSYNFTKGIDTKTDEYQVSGKLSELENGVFQTTGSVRKRNGYEQIGAASPLTVGNAIAGFDNEVVAIDNQKLYSYSQEQDAFNLKGYKTAVDIHKNSIIKNNYAQTYPSTAYHVSGLKFFTWIDSAGANYGEVNSIFYSVIDSATGNNIVANQHLVGQATPIATLVFGNFFVFVYQESTTGQIRYIKIPVATPQTPSSFVAIITVASTGCAAVVLNNRIYVTYSDATGVKAFYLDATFVKSAVVSVNANIASKFTMYADLSLNQIWVGYFTSSSVVSYLVLSVTLTTVLAVVAVETLTDTPSNITIVANNGVGRIYYDLSEFYPTTQALVPYIKSALLTNGGVVTLVGVFIRDVGLYSKAFYYDNDFYVVTIHSSYFQGTYFVLNSAAKVVAKLVPNGGGPLSYGLLSDIGFVAVNIFSVAIVERNLAVREGDTIIYDLGVSEEVLTFKNPLVTQNIGNNLHVSGGLLSMYDGVNVVEHGFNLFPEDVVYSPLPYNGTLSSTSLGAYQYSATYEWTDNQGQLHQSAPSVAESVTNSDIVKFFGTLTSGSNVITNVTFNSFGVMINMLITGTGIPAGTTITDFTASTVTMSSNATAPILTATITAASQDIRAFITNPTFNYLQFNPIATNNYFYLLGTCVSGSSTMTVRDASKLKINYVLKYKNYLTTNAIVGKRGYMTAMEYYPRWIIALLSDNADLTNFTQNMPVVSYKVTYAGSVATYTQSPGAVTGYIDTKYFYANQLTIKSAPVHELLSTPPAGWDAVNYPYIGKLGEVTFGTVTVTDKYKIVAITGNEVTVDVPFQFSAIDQFIDVSRYLTDNPGVAGRNFIDIPNWDFTSLFVGDKLYSTSFTSTYVTISSFTYLSGPLVTRIFFTGGVTTTGTTAIFKSFNVSHYVKIGNTITGSGITGTANVTNVNDFANQIEIDQNLTGSFAANYTIGNLYSTAIAIPTLRLTDKIINPVVLSVWRTLLNESIFYKLTTIANPIYNDISVDYKDFFDDVSDTRLEGSSLLYTTGGVIENIEIPAVDILVSYRNRLIGVPSESPYTMWYSKQVIPGTPVQFSDLFVINVDQKGGPLTGLAPMDDKLILFKQSLIFYMVGDGPAATGINNDFTQPQLISTDSGCINKKSIVITPIGTMYKSAKGIYLLDRALEVKYIGADVEAYNQDIITSAQLVSNYNQVRFTLSSGVTLMYDYYFQQWSVFKNYDAIDTTVVGASSSASTYYMLKNNGVVNVETNEQYLDNGAYIPLKIVTNWLNMAGLQGYERFYKVLVIGHYESPHNLNFKSYFDFNETEFQNTVIPVETDPGIYQYRIFLNRQKCESVKFSLQDSELAPLGEGYRLSAIAFEVGIKKGLNKMVASKSYG